MESSDKKIGCIEGEGWVISNSMGPLVGDRPGTFGIVAPEVRY